MKSVVMGCFLSCVYQPDAPQYAITTRVKKSMAGYHLSYKEQVSYNDSPRLWKIKLSTKFTTARQLYNNFFARIFIVCLKVLRYWNTHMIVME
jgi:hypothetical protein